MLDDAEQAWKAAGVADALHLERFAASFSAGAEGGTIRTFARRVARTVEADGATTVLQAGEQAGIQMPFGCRMGICHTCVAPLAPAACAICATAPNSASPTPTSPPEPSRPASRLLPATARST